MVELIPQMELSDSSSELQSKPLVISCDVCHSEVPKYRCPRCASRTCSLQCSKMHKVQNECSGIRDSTSFTRIKRLADYTAPIVMDDKKFIDSCSSVSSRKIYAVPTTANSAPANEDESAGIHDDSKTRQTCCTHKNSSENSSGNQLQEQQSSSNQEIGDDSNEHSNWKTNTTRRYLLNNSRRRRVWLSFSSDDNENSSRHEQFSDTIFWMIKVIFRREDDEKGIIDYTHTVKNIPETISVATLIRQFVKPKKIGPVVNKADLDADKMQPFQEAGLDSLMIYMPVPIEGKERYYVVDPSKPILDNTRNRFIIDNPTLIVTLNDQCNSYVMLSEQEAQEMRESQRQTNRDDSRNNFRNFNNNRGFQRRGRGQSRDFRSFKRPFGNRGGRPPHSWKKSRPDSTHHASDRNSGNFAMTGNDSSESNSPFDFWLKAVEFNSKIDK